MAATREVHQNFRGLPDCTLLKQLPPESLDGFNTARYDYVELQHIRYCVYPGLRTLLVFVTTRTTNTDATYVLATFSHDRKPTWESTMSS